MDQYEDIDRFANEYSPKQTMRAGPEILKDGGYAFEIIDAAVVMVGTPEEPIFRLGLKVIDGPYAGTILERPTFFRRSQSLDYLGGDMVALGLDAASWGKRGKPWSKELIAACPQLVGKRFRGRVRTRENKDDTNKPYRDLLVDSLIRKQAGTVNAAPAQAPIHKDSESGEQIPF